jgi:vacuolar-type H+-ATPase subunit I/STV1
VIEEEGSVSEFRRSLWESTKESFTKLVDFFSKGLSWWFALVGLVLIVIGGIHPSGLSDNLSKMFSSIGSSVLVGGVFGVLLKSDQYFTIFEESLRKIFFGAKEQKGDLLTVFRQEVREALYGKAKQSTRAISSLSLATRSGA